MKFEIKNRFSGELIFSIETDSWKLAVEAAIKAKSNLSYANLSSANLRYADLRSGQLVQFRDDIWAVLSSQPLEVIGLRQALVDGKINGSSYEGECACLVGTIAKVANKKYDCLPVLKPNQSRPAEIFFMLINIGDVPEKSKWSKMAVEWIDEWSSNMQMAFGKK